MKLRRLAVIALILISSNIVPVFALNLTPESVAQRVNIAGRQRMLSQRMVKAACLIVTDINPAAASVELAQSYDLFIRHNGALRLGDVDMAIHAESFSDVMSALQKIDPHLAAFDPIVAQALDHSNFNPSDLTTMDAASLTLENFMSVAVFKTARTYAAHVQGISLGQAITIDIAGRQRMLSQRAVKEACLMQTAPDPQDEARRLAKTVRLFDASMIALREGFADLGVVAPKKPALVQKLDDVAGLWDLAKRHLEKASAGQILSKAELIVLSAVSEQLLDALEEAVAMYANE